MCCKWQDDELQLAVCHLEPQRTGLEVQHYANTKTAKLKEVE